MTLLLRKLDKPRDKQLKCWMKCGFPQEMQQFVNCILGKVTCMETREADQEVLKIKYTAYRSAGEGLWIDFPTRPTDCVKTD